MQETGFLTNFENRIITLFSAAGYGGGTNLSAVLIVKNDLFYEIKVCYEFDADFNEL